MMRRNWVIVLLGLLAYAPVLRLGFFFDDHSTIENDATIRRWTVTNVVHDFRIPTAERDTAGYYRPLETFLNRIEYTLWQLRPLGYHAVNLALHLISALLLVSLITALGLPADCAFWSGALFAVHPLPISELMMVSGRPELLAFMLCLVSLACWLQPDHRHFIWGALAYGAALLAKESAMMLPVAIVGLGFFTKQYPRWKFQFAAAMAISMFYMLLRAWAFGHYELGVTHVPAFGFIFGTFPSVVLRYLILIIAPFPLYLYRLQPDSQPILMGSAILLFGIIFLLWFAGGRWGRLSVVWGVASLLPKIPLLWTGHYMLDHWAYPLLPAVLVPVAYFCTAKRDSAIARRIGTVVPMILLIAWTGLDHFYAAVRRDDESNYRWALRYTQSTPLLFNLGLICLRTGRAQEAKQYLEPVYRLYPGDPNISATWRLAQSVSKN